MRIRKVSQSIGVVGKVLNTISNSLVNTYSASFINKLILNIAHPVNSIYITVSDENPQITLGGEWIRFAQGKALVGVDEDDTDFNKVEKELGKKTYTLTVNEMPSHIHRNIRGVKVSSPGAKDVPDTSWDTGSKFAVGVNTDSTGGGQAHNNIQPSITVYFWKRVA